MTREWLGIVALNAALIAVGTSLLAGVGLAPLVSEALEPERRKR
jgi:hypothetical protein